MHQFPKSVKLFGLVLAFGLIFWIGGWIARTAIGFDIFISGTELVLKDWCLPAEISQTVYLFSMLAVYTDTAYIAAIVSAVIIAFLFKGRIKERGWLFMALILLFITIPVQGWIICEDIRINLVIAEYGRDAKQAVEIFLTRQRNILLNALGTLSFLSVMTSVIYLVWQPLDRTNETEFLLNKEEENEAVRNTE